MAKAKRATAAVDVCVDPKGLERVINMSLDVDNPFFVWGPPGIGKSQIINQVAASRDLEVCDIRAVTCDPMDLRGLPFVEERKGGKVAAWANPAFFPTKGKGIIFLDELPQASSLVQSACLSLVLDRKVGDYHVPDGWAICAAGNRETDRTGANSIISSLLNRFTHYTLEPSPKYWSQVWAPRNGISTKIRAFINQFPQYLIPEDGTSKASKAFATPRSWEMASHYLVEYGDTPDTWTAIRGTVGLGTTTAFKTFCDVYQDEAWPDIEAHIKDPKPLPKGKPSLCYAVCTALAERVRTLDAGTDETPGPDLPRIHAILESIRFFPEKEYHLSGLCQALAMNQSISHCKDGMALYLDDPDIVAVLC